MVVPWDVILMVIIVLASLLITLLPDRSQRNQRSGRRDAADEREMKWYRDFHDPDIRSGSR
ncbi:MAG: hypothetical protein KatS3mg004_1869 [Bryobacteraceae bacterium]|nr:MAG: hypothetical protein KatS3mg004_1869 [Bryobacteraceae bacterium]